MREERGGKGRCGDGMGRQEEGMEGEGERGREKEREVIKKKKSHHSITALDSY